MIEIDLEKCSGCNLCCEVCVAEHIAKGPSIDPGVLCVSCGHCYAICPEEAITVTGYEQVATAELSGEPAVSPEAMLALLRARRSGRSFREGPVSREDLLRVIESASLAPSAHNVHPVKAYVYTDRGVISTVRVKTLRFYRLMAAVFRSRLFSVLWRLGGMDTDELAILVFAFEKLIETSGTRDILFFDAGTILVFTAPRGNFMAAGDAWIAAQNAVNFAETIGVSTCYNGFLIMAGRWDPTLRKAMGIPRGETVIAALTLGYPKRRFLREAPRGMMQTTWI